MICKAEFSLKLSVKSFFVEVQMCFRAQDEISRLSLKGKIIKLEIKVPTDEVQSSCQISLNHEYL